MNNFVLLVFAGLCQLAASGIAAPPPLQQPSSSFNRDLAIPRALPVEQAPQGVVSSTARIDENYTLRPGDRVSFGDARFRLGAAPRSAAT